MLALGPNICNHETIQCGRQYLGDINGRCIIVKPTDKTNKLHGGENILCGEAWFDDNGTFRPMTDISNLHEIY